MNTLKELEKLEKTKESKRNFRHTIGKRTNEKPFQNRRDRVDRQSFDGPRLLEIKRRFALQFAFFSRVLRAANWPFGEVWSEVDLHNFSQAERLLLFEEQGAV